MSLERSERPRARPCEASRRSTGRHDDLRHGASSVCWFRNEVDGQALPRIQTRRSFSTLLRRASLELDRAQTGSDRDPDPTAASSTTVICGNFISLKRVGPESNDSELDARFGPRPWMVPWDRSHETSAPIGSAMVAFYEDARTHGKSTTRSGGGQARASLPRTLARGGRTLCFGLRTSRGRW